MCKEDFIAILEVVLVCADLDVTKLTLINNGHVEITFEGGGKRTANIEADSKSAIIRDVLRCCC